MTKINEFEKTKIQTQLIQYTMCTHAKMYCQNKKLLKFINYLYYIIYYLFIKLKSITVIFRLK